MARRVHGAQPAAGARGDARANRALMDQIAKAFDETRSRPWGPVVRFLDGLPKGARVLDLAAGNGRHCLAAAKRGLRPVALEVSRLLPRRLAARARNDRLEVDVIEGDAARLPLRDARFAHAVFIAGLHAIEGRAMRHAALKELRRVLAPDGSALVSVWTRDQDRFRDVVDQSPAPPLGSIAPGSPEPGDISLAWTHQVDDAPPRFFHLYRADELRSDLEATGFRIVGWEDATLTGSSAPDNYFVTVRRA